MIRTFETHALRPSTELGGFWRVLREDGVPAGRILIPGCAESLPGYENFQGVLLYERDVQLSQAQNVLLTFHGVSFRAEVYWDGEKIAQHYNAYTAFTAFVPGTAAGRHTLRVRVDNRFGEDSALHIPNDYFSYNGINRPVQMDFVGEDFLEWVHLTPLKTENGWQMRAEGQVRRSGENVLCAEIALAGKMCRAQVRRDGSFSTVFDAGKVREWSPDSPELYEVRTVLYRNGEAADDLIERTGFRTVEVRGNRLCINGREIFPKGFCRHEDVPVYGSAVPFEAMVYDIQILRDLGCNSVRITHYPSDQRFLDLCDEWGILVWEENHARGLEEDRMRNPNFERQCEDCIREMVCQHFNHPSVYIWGILNECASDTAYGRSCYEKQFALLRSLDASRPVTFASCKFFTDICLDLVDVVSMNLYAGWYHDTPPDVYIRQISEWVQNSGGDGKPLIISEFGAGAIYGFHDHARGKWSEERQSDLLREQMSAYFGSEAVSGCYIWQFCDVKVCEEWVEKRPKCENNKGVVDRYRRPKFAYDTVKECMRIR